MDSKKKFEDISQAEKYSMYQQSTFIHMGMFSWDILLTLILTTQFDSLCLISPELIDSERQFVHHPSIFKEYFDDVDSKGFEKLRQTAMGDSTTQHEINAAAVLWQVVEKKNRQGNPEITGTLLLPLILMGSFKNFCDIVVNCLDHPGVKGLDRKAPHKVEWRKTDDGLYKKSDPEYDAAILGDSDFPRESVEPSDSDDSDNEDPIIEYNPANDEDYVPTEDENEDTDEDEDSDTSEEDFSDSKTCNTGGRYIIIPLSIEYYNDIEPDKNSGHAAVLVFDREKAQIQHFDPNGDSTMPFYLEDGMFDQIMKSFKGFYKKLCYPHAAKLPLTIRKSKDVCYNGPQVNQDFGLKKSKEMIRMSAFLRKKYGKRKADKYIKEYEDKMMSCCTVWSFMYMYMVLYYPNADTDEIATIMATTEKETLHDIIAEVIHILSSLIHTIYQEELAYRDIISLLSSKHVRESLAIEKYFAKPGSSVAVKPKSKPKPKRRRTGRY